MLVGLLRKEDEDEKEERLERPRNAKSQRALMTRRRLTK
jgi:hypothetical protein